MVRLVSGPWASTNIGVACCGRGRVWKRTGLKIHDQPRNAGTAITQPMMIDHRVSQVTFEARSDLESASSSVDAGRSASRASAKLP